MKERERGWVLIGGWCGSECHGVFHQQSFCFCVIVSFTPSFSLLFNPPCHHSSSYALTHHSPHHTIAHTTYHTSMPVCCPLSLCDCVSTHPTLNQTTQHCNLLLVLRSWHSQLELWLVLTKKIMDKWHLGCFEAFHSFGKRAFFQ